MSFDFRFLPAISGVEKISKKKIKKLAKEDAGLVVNQFLRHLEAKDFSESLILMLSLLKRQGQDLNGYANYYDNLIASVLEFEVYYNSHIGEEGSIKFIQDAAAKEDVVLDGHTASLMVLPLRNLYFFKYFEKKWQNPIPVLEPIVQFVRATKEFEIKKLTNLIRLTENDIEKVTSLTLHGKSFQTNIIATNYVKDRIMEFILPFDPLLKQICRHHLGIDYYTSQEYVATFIEEVYNGVGFKNIAPNNLNRLFEIILTEARNKVSKSRIKYCLHSCLLPVYANFHEENEFYGRRPKHSDDVVAYNQHRRNTISKLMKK